MRLLLHRTRLRASALANTVAFVLAGLGILAIDQMLVAVRRNEAQRVAGETAVFVRGFLDVHEQALQIMRTLFIRNPDLVSAREFREVISVLDEQGLAFQRLWLTDSMGVVQHEWSFGEDAPSTMLGADVDTLRFLELRAIASLARRSREAQSSRTGTLYGGQRGFVILEPLYTGDGFVGFAGGTITGESVIAALDAVVRDDLHTRLILASNDTLAVDGAGGPPRFVGETSRAELTAPGPATWEVVIFYDAGYHRRWVLLMTAALLMGSLTIAFVHARRQALRLSERTVELERLSAELLRANRAKSEFLASVSHELRTPLNAIVGFIDMLRDGVYGEMPPRQAAPIARVASSATHLRVLVDQILDIAKLAAGRMEYHAEPVDVRGLVTEVASEIESLLNERDLHLRLLLADDLTRISTDRTHLRQILLNLFGNAIKYTGEGGIVVEAKLADPASVPPHLTGIAPPSPVTGEISTMPPVTRWVSVAVTDSGVGIAPADFDRIFEEFEQVNAGPRTDSMVRGTGLGLAISRRLARLIGGDITVTSEIGRGSTFTVWLPAEA
ncbi:MAG TPA: ATP-binding protein [Gemmatimonadaceae bacterium]|nr:ATP-binding protein [Gemmatimonadaceae bacterium]